MPRLRPDWSQVREFTWPVEGTYEGIVLSDEEHAKEVLVDEESELWEVRFRVKLVRCRDREDGKIVLDTEKREVVDTLEIGVSLPTSGPMAWRLQEFLRVLGYGRSGKVDEVDTNDWHGKRVVLKVVKGVSKKTGREYTTVRFVGRAREEAAV